MDSKPITVLRQEFADSLCKIVNDYPLPSFVMRYILRDLDNILAQREQMEYQRDLKGKEEPKNE